MADLSLTVANVAPVLNGNERFINDYNAGANITAGQEVYLDTTATPPNWKLADSDSGTALARVAGGTALHGSLSGQPLKVQVGGSITIGATMTAGLAYYLSKTAGGICPVADIASGGYSQVVGIASSTTVLKLISGGDSGVAV